MFWISLPLGLILVFGSWLAVFCLRLLFLRFYRLQRQITVDGGLKLPQEKSRV